MNVAQVVELLEGKKADLTLIKEFYTQHKFEERLTKLSQTVEQESFWQHPDNIKIAQEHRKTKDLVDKFTDLTTEYQDATELVQEFAQSPEQLEELGYEVRQLCKKIDALKIELLLSDKNDQKSCYLSINPGAGGTESQDWADMLLRMYLRFCEQEGLRVKIVDRLAGEEAGIKSATLYISGKNSYGLLKSEHGTHRLVRISPFDASKRRHTSFAGVRVTPEAEEAQIQIKPEDLKIETYRASGAGGQHVNTTDSAVRITHLPTGITAQCQNERSQLQNKTHALKILQARLVEAEEEKRRAEEKDQVQTKMEWGSQIRSYVLHPYKMVKDHRTSQESSQPDAVLDGELNTFIQAYLVSHKT